MTRSVVSGRQYSSFPPPYSERIVSSSGYVAGEDEESSSLVEQGSSTTWSTANQHIYHLPTDRLTLKVPIPVRVVEADDGEWLASFEEAQISIQGDDIADAYVSLLYDIVDAFDCLTENRGALSVFMEWQLSVLENFIQVR